MKIELKSKKYVVKGINKKTQAHMFKNIEVDDIIQLSTEVKFLGKYAAPVTVTNLTKNESSTKTFNSLPLILSYFELIEE